MGRKESIESAPFLQDVETVFEHPVRVARTESRHRVLNQVGKLVAECECHTDGCQHDKRPFPSQSLEQEEYADDICRNPECFVRHHHPETVRPWGAPTVDQKGYVLVGVVDGFYD